MPQVGAYTVGCRTYRVGEVRVCICRICFVFGGPLNMSCCCSMQHYELQCAKACFDLVREEPMRRTSTAAGNSESWEFHPHCDAFFH